MSDTAKIGLAGAVLVLLCSAGYWAVTYRSETRARAAQFSWMRSQAIQRWQTVEESDWNVPPTGRMLRSYPAIHHWDRYVSGSHEECSGTGTTRRCSTELDYSDRPVYYTKYDYEIERWVTVRTPTLEGADQSPIWPDVSDLRAAHEPPQIGDERPGMRTSRYTVVLQAERQTYTLDITEERWASFRPGASYVVVLNILGQPMDIRS
jgi:hypothetical protein